MKKEAEDSLRHSRGMMEQYRGGRRAAGETDLLSMIILAYYFRETNDPVTEEYTQEVLDFILAMDLSCPLHYSYWLALAYLLCENPFDFFRGYSVQATGIDYDPFQAVNPVFYATAHSEEDIPVAIHSTLLKDRLAECLAKNDSLSRAVQKWIDYEEAILRNPDQIAV